MSGGSSARRVVQPDPPYWGPERRQISRRNNTKIGAAEKGSVKTETEHLARLGRTAENVVIKYSSDKDKKVACCAVNTTPLLWNKGV